MTSLPKMKTYHGHLGHFDLERIVYPILCLECLVKYLYIEHNFETHCTVIPKTDTLIYRNLIFKESIEIFQGVHQIIFPLLISEF